MNAEDSAVANAERDASPNRFQSRDSSDRRRGSNTEHRSGQHRAADHAVALTQAADDAEPEAAEEVEEPSQSLSHDIRSARRRADDDASSSSSCSTSSSAAVQSTRPGSGPSLRPRRQSGASNALSSADTGIERDIMDYLDRHPTAVARMDEFRLQHSVTVGSSRQRPTEDFDLPPFGGNKPYPPQLPEREEYVVEFAGYDDPKHAQNFAPRRKLIIASVLVFASWWATFASSVFSAGAAAVGQEFNVGRETTTLGTSLFVLGYAMGPSVFAPVSELYGRRTPIIIAAAGFSIFNTAVACSKDYQTLMISRFFSGFFGSAPLAITGAVFADMFDNSTRGIAVAAFAAALYAGPFSGPMVGGFISKSYLGWRWTAWLPALMGYVSFILSVYFQEETYGPVILVSKAAELRRLTRNWGIHAKQEEVEIDLKELAIKNVTRPLRILFTEPIVLLMTIYMSFIYGLLYLSLTAYSIVFSDVFGFSLGVAGIPFMALILGAFIGFAAVVMLNKSYVRKLEANNNVPVPEWRLPIAMVGGIVFAIGLFWFGWAGYRQNTHWIAPTLAGLFLGFGIFTVSIQCLNYIIDAYLMFAASAIAANTIMRSIFGAVFPMFAVGVCQVYRARCGENY